MVPSRRARWRLAPFAVAWLGTVVALRCSQETWLEEPLGDWAGLSGALARLTCLAAGLVLLHLYLRPPERLVSWQGLARSVLYVTLLFLGGLCAQPYSPPAVTAWAAIAVGALVIGLAISILARPAGRLLRRSDVLLMNLALLAVGLEVGLRVLAAFSASPLFAQAGDLGGEAEVAFYRRPPGSFYHGERLNRWSDADTEPRARRPGECLAVVIGDSFSEGVVPHAYHFTTFAERRLPGCEVYNMGHSGLGPAAYLHLLRTRAVLLDPQVIVIDVYVGNDLGPPGAEAPDGAWLDRERLRAFVVGRRLFRLARENALLRHGGSGTRRGRQSGALGGESVLRAMPWLEDYRLENPSLSEPGYLDLQTFITRLMTVEWRGGGRFLSTLAEILRSGGGAPILVMLIPTEPQVEDKLWNRVERRIGRGPLVRDQPQRLIDAWLARRHVPTLDLLPVLRAAPREADGDRHLYHLRDTHFNSRGNRIVGEALADFIRPYLREKPR